MKPESRITDPPAIFLRKVAAMSDLKGLENIHRILHAWMAEVQSASPRTKVGNGWSAKLIHAAHEAVVGRITQLNPDFKHDSPIKAAKPDTEGPVMLVPNYVSIVGSTLDGEPDADKDVVIRDDRGNESLEIRIAQLLGGDAHVIYNPAGPHDLESKPLYHLALVPIAVWDSMTQVSSPISAAMEAYRSAIQPVVDDHSYRHRIIVGSGLLRRRIFGSMPLVAAVSEGLAAGRWVVEGGMDYPLIAAKRSVLSAASRADKLYSTAAGVFVGLVKEPEDREAYAEALKRIYAQILEWLEDDPFDNEDDALDAARELGASEASKLLGNQAKEALSV